MQAPGQVQLGFEGSREGLGGFSAEPGQVQQGSEEGSGEGSRKPWCKASHVQRVPEKVAEKVPEKFVFSSFCFHACTHGIHGCH